MPRLKELVAQRAAARAVTGRRTSIARVLVLTGLALVSSTVFLLSLTLLVPMPPWATLSISVVFIVSAVALGLKYRRTVSREREAKRVPVKSYITVIVATFLLLGVVVFGLSFFTSISIAYDFSEAPAELEIVLLLAVVLALVVYFSAAPFIMATWYRTAPAMARLVLKIHALFHRRRPTIETRVMVTPLPQGHSLVVSIKRAFTWLIFSSSITFIAWVPLFERGPLPLLPGFSSVDSVAFVHFSIGHLVHLILPVVLSFFAFAWLVPPCYLLDDAGVVFFRRFTARRQPLEVSSISSWFLGVVKAVLGTGALITYALFVVARAGVITTIASQLGVLAAVQYALFMFGFPFTGTLLMATMLLAFQESQFNKLKTFLYQQLARDGIDPRLVVISFQDTGTFQDNTLLDYPGENFFHAPPLRDVDARLRGEDPATP